MKYICRSCEGESPCILDVYENCVPPTTCPWRGYFSNENLCKSKWQELPESDYFGMRGFGKTQIAENCVENCTKKKQETPNKRGKILLKALDIINGERQDQYGSPEDSFSLIADYWTTFLNSRDFIPSNKTTHALKISAKEVAEMMMLFKIARMSGQKPKLDNYLDLVGYAGIAADMIDEEKNKI